MKVLVSARGVVVSWQERSKLMDAKHAMLLDRAAAAKDNCEKVVTDYKQLVTECKYQDYLTYAFRFSPQVLNLSRPDPCSVDFGRETPKF